ncbi:MAG: radical SAM protein [Patescibacteria group bacterium]|nr:radical SAM protein [Patescibacteria group bacterium]
MIIETSTTFFETHFQHAQLEVTGRCNMRCKHCRAWDEARVNLPIPVIETISDFVVAEGDSDFRMTISGGEPFLRKDLPQIISIIKDKGIESVIITTNGSLVDEDVLEKLAILNLRNLCIQVSIDSVDHGEHDAFREYPGAFEKAVHALDLTNKFGLVSSLRATMTESRIGQIHDLVRLALEHRAIRIGIGSVIPVGRGKENNLGMTPVSKRRFLEELTSCKQQYPNIDITTEDPLKFALNRPDIWSYGDDIDPTDPDVFGGCTAGVTGFNVSSDGIITPCAVLLEKITTADDKTVSDLQEAYATSPIIKALFERQLGGKCGACNLRRVCGGCRAVAYGATGDYLECDTTCWH